MKPWTRKEIARLRRLYRFWRVRDIASKLHRSESAVRNRIRLLRLKRNLFHRPWTLREEARLRKLYPHLPSTRVAKLLGRTLASVSGWSHKLHLHKTASYLASPAACRMRRGDHIGRATQFPKGHVPANKGLRRPGYSKFHGRMADTCFKKGNKPGNYFPVGTVRKDFYGYLRVKIADGVGGTGNAKVWAFVHRRVWEAAHGPIPKGYRLWWKDGNHENCALENLELLSGQEHIERTRVKFENFPQELKDTIRTAAGLKNRIRRRLREEQTQ